VSEAWLDRAFIWLESAFLFGAGMAVGKSGGIGKDQQMMFQATSGRLTAVQTNMPFLPCCRTTAILPDGRPVRRRNACPSQAFRRQRRQSFEMDARCSLEIGELFRQANESQVTPGGPGPGRSLLAAGLDDAFGPAAGWRWHVSSRSRYSQICKLRGNRRYRPMEQSG